MPPEPLLWYTAGGHAPRARKCGIAHCSGWAWKPLVTCTNQRPGSVQVESAAGVRVLANGDSNSDSQVTMVSPEWPARGQCQTSTSSLPVAPYSSARACLQTVRGQAGMGVRALYASQQPCLSKLAKVCHPLYSKACPWAVVGTQAGLQGRSPHSLRVAQKGLLILSHRIFSFYCGDLSFCCFEVLGIKPLVSPEQGSVAKRRLQPCGSASPQHKSHLSPIDK